MKNAYEWQSDVTAMGTTPSTGEDGDEPHE